MGKSNKIQVQHFLVGPNGHLTLIDFRGHHYSLSSDLISGGVVSSGDIKLDKIVSRIYNEGISATGDINFDISNSLIGGIAIIYHNDSTVPSLTNIPGTILSHDSYLINTLNQILIAKTGDTTFTVTYSQPVVTIQ